MWSNIYETWLYGENGVGSLKSKYNVKVGDKFDCLTVIEYCKGKKNGCWKCKCDCGEINYRGWKYLVESKSRKSCKKCHFSSIRKPLLKKFGYNSERSTRPWESWEISFLQLALHVFTRKEICSYLNRSENSLGWIIKNNFKDSNKIKIGHKYNKLTVLEFIGGNKFGRKQYKCLCDCGNITICTTLNLKNDYVKGCMKCRPKKKSQSIGKISRGFYSSIKHQAKKRQKQFSISQEYVSYLYDKQRGRCALSNILLETTEGTIFWGGTASLDRINSSQGYIEGNVQWLHKDVNRMKWELPQEEFINICGLVYKNSLEEYDDKTNDWW